MYQTKRSISRVVMVRKLFDMPINIRRKIYVFSHQSVTRRDESIDHNQSSSSSTSSACALRIFCTQRIRVSVRFRHASTSATRVRRNGRKEAPCNGHLHTYMTNGFVGRRGDLDTTLVGARISPWRLSGCQERVLDEMCFGRVAKTMFKPRLTVVEHVYVVYGGQVPRPLCVLQ